MLYWIKNNKGQYITKFGSVTVENPNEIERDKYALKICEEFANVLVAHLNKTDNGLYIWELESVEE